MSRRVRTVAAVFLAAMVLAGSYVAWLKSNDTSTYYEYDAYTDVDADSSPAAALVASVAPPSARHIWGWYDVDVAVGACEFELDSADRQQLVASRFETRYRRSARSGREDNTKL